MLYALEHTNAGLVALSILKLSSLFWCPNLRMLGSLPTVTRKLPFLSAWDFVSLCVGLGMHRSSGGETRDAQELFLYGLCESAWVFAQGLAAVFRIRVFREGQFPSKQA